MRSLKSTRQLIRCGPSLGPTEWEGFEVVNHCQLRLAGMPLGVLFKMRHKGDEETGEHEFYKVCLLNPIRNPDGTQTESLSALNRQAMMQRLVELLDNAQ